MMNSLSTYILEKLKINKDTKVSTNTEKSYLTNLIMSIIQYDTEKEDVLDEVRKWIKDNDVEYISIYCNEENENGKEYRDKLDKGIKTNINFVPLDKYITQFHWIFPMVMDYNKFIKFSDSHFSMKTTDKGIEFEKKEYEILIKKETLR